MLVIGFVRWEMREARASRLVLPDVLVPTDSHDVGLAWLDPRGGGRKGAVYYSQSMPVELRYLGSRTVM